MDYKKGDKYLVTTSEWFVAPDGQQYRAVFGMVVGVHQTKDALDVPNTRHHANWYLQIGNARLAGCQIKYAIETDQCSRADTQSTEFYNGEFVRGGNQSVVYFAEEV